MRGEAILGDQRADLFLAHALPDASIFAPGLALAFDLPGHGADPTPRREVNLNVYSRAISDQIAAIDAPDIIAVAHSIGGAALLGALPVAGARLSKIILIAALVPEPGRRFCDYLTPRRRELFEAAAIAAPDCACPMPYRLAQSVYFNDLPVAAARKCFNLLTPQPWGAWIEPFNFDPCAPRPRCDYLICEKDRCFPDTTYLESARRIGAGPRRFPSGHDAMLSRPALLAASLSAA